MIFNNSMLRFNVAYKGMEIGFAPFETKNLTRKLSEKDEKDLADKYGFLIFKPNKKKAVKKVEETIENSKQGMASKLADIIDKAKEELTTKEISPTADYTTKDSIVIAQKETIVQKEDDVKDIIEGKETISLSKPNKKKLEITESDFEVKSDDDVKTKSTKKSTKKASNKTSKKTTKK